MRDMKTVPAVIVFLVFLVLPVQAFSEVKISLKNGREIIADSCVDSNGKLVCEKMGGSFEIDKKDILAMKGITVKHPPSPQVPEEKTGQAAEAGKKGPVKPEAETTGSEVKSEGGLAKGLNPGDEKRLDQIDRKKIEYQAERQRLLNERQRLDEDIKNAGVISSKEKYDEMQKRLKDLDDQVKSFNEKVMKLNEEEKQILGGAKK